jgi:3-methyladenine DNA glycosylase AlkC
MAEKLKTFFGEAMVRAIAAEIRAVYPAFAATRFVREGLTGLEALELTARAGHVATVLDRHLPAEFPEAARILVASLGPELDGSDSFGFAPFRYLPHVIFAARRGLHHFEAAMHLQHELTRRFTAEFSIRAYLETQPERTLARLRRWASDPSVHVRRLVSEGTRPRLPWAPQLKAFRADPTAVLALLDLLKDDPELYVRRSVANNLNDIGKDHPDRLVETCRQWSRGASPERSWIIGHALRSLVKRGHPGALGLLGFAAAPRVRVDRARISPGRVRLGGKLRFSLDLVSTAARPQDLLADFTVHFVKASGKTAPKVFKLRRLVLPAKGRLSLEGRVSFADLTTRRHYPGLHRLDLLLNGVRFPIGQAQVER